MHDQTIQIICYINIVIFIYFLALCTGYTILLIASFPDIIRKFEEVKYGNINELISKNFSIPLTIVIPTYNLPKQVLTTVTSILNNDYSNISILVVNDGSTDNTLESLIEFFDFYQTPMIVRQKIKTAPLKGFYNSRKYPNLFLLDKEHSNTGDTLNVGINACNTPLFASVDADTLLNKEAITRIIFSFLSNKSCVIVGGAVYVLNDNTDKDGMLIKNPIVPKATVPALQVCEYFRSFIFARCGWNCFGGALSYAGAFTMIEKKVAVDVGGYDENNYAQDAEIVLKIHKYMRKNKLPYTVDFNPTAFSWTEVPWTLYSFWRQRDHWQRGLLRSFCLNRSFLFNPKYGVVGFFSYPFYLFFELLAPIVEFAAYFLLYIGLKIGIIESYFVIGVFIALAAGFICFITVANVFLNLITFNQYSSWKDTMKLIFLSFFEMILFRQYHVLCKVIATLRYFFNRMLGKRL